jgi:hypothetical protein
MKNNLKKTSLWIALTVLMLGACKKSTVDQPMADNRKIRYELTGNFTGKLTIIYNDNVNGNTIVSEVSLPWSKEITYANNIQGIGIGGSSTSFGTPGQTATLKIYANGIVKVTDTRTAGFAGELSLPTLSYNFK